MTSPEPRFVSGYRGVSGGVWSGSWGRARDCRGQPAGRAEDVERDEQVQGGPASDSIERRWWTLELEHIQDPVGERLPGRARQILCNVSQQIHELQEGWPKR